MQDSISNKTKINKSLDLYPKPKPDWPKLWLPHTVLSLTSLCFGAFSVCFKTAQSQRQCKRWLASEAFSAPQSSAIIWPFPLAWAHCILLLGAFNFLFSLWGRGHFPEGMWSLLQCQAHLRCYLRISWVEYDWDKKKIVEKSYETFVTITRSWSLISKDRTGDCSVCL